MGKGVSLFDDAKFNIIIIIIGKFFFFFFFFRQGNQRPPVGCEKERGHHRRRGCGKSSICRRLLAHDKRFKLMSLDDLIVYEESMSIPEIVSKHSWNYFR